MPIISTEILFKLSTTSGSAGNSANQPSPNASLGKYISTTQLVDNTINNLFDDVTGDENATSNVDYRCLFVHNNNSSITWISPVVWVSADTAGGANVAIGLDPAGVTAIGSSPAQATSIASDTTAPTGVTFSYPTTKAAGVVLANIPPGYCAAIWVQRTATNSAALNSDGCIIRAEGDTTA